MIITAGRPREQARWSEPRTRFSARTVCNSYLLDVWTVSSYRRQGIGGRMIGQLMGHVPGQILAFKPRGRIVYTALGFRH
jgi:hypothetical protein